MPGKNIKRGLGKGLDTLIPTGEMKISGKSSSFDSKEDGIVNESKKTVNIIKVEPNRKQPRKNFDEDALQELADSIKQVGILEPILVKDQGDYFEIIAGERRWRAAKLAGLKEVPVVIRNDLTEQQIVEIQLIENIQRENLNPIEEAVAYKRLMTEFNLKQDEVADKVSKSRVAITNSMRLLKLCPEVQQMVIDAKLTTGHARAIISIEDSAEQLKIAEKIFDEKLSVRKAEKIVKNYGKPEKQKKEINRNESMETIYRNLEEKCKIATGTKVQIASKGDGTGKIEIDFYNSDDLEKITDLLVKGMENTK